MYIFYIFYKNVTYIFKNKLYRSVHFLEKSSSTQISYFKNLNQLNISLTANFKDMSK